VFNGWRLAPSPEQVIVERVVRFHNDWIIFSCEFVAICMPKFSAIHGPGWLGRSLTIQVFMKFVPAFLEVFQNVGKVALDSSKWWCRATIRNSERNAVLELPRPAGGFRTALRHLRDYLAILSPTPTFPK
jgi:hypothetical protein